MVTSNTIPACFQQKISEDVSLSYKAPESSRELYNCLNTRVAYNAMSRYQKCPVFLIIPMVPKELPAVQMVLSMVRMPYPMLPLMLCQRHYWLYQWYHWCHCYTIDLLMVPVVPTKTPMVPTVLPVVRTLSPLVPLFIIMQK